MLASTRRSIRYDGPIAERAERDLKAMMAHLLSVHFPSSFVFLATVCFLSEHQLTRRHVGILRGANHSGNDDWAGVLS